MKEYLHRFYSESDYQDYLNESYEEPTVGTIQSGISGELKKIFFNHYEHEVSNHKYEDMYLTFDVLSSGTIIWKSLGSGQAKTISYSKDNGQTWTEITATSGGVTINVNTGDKVLFKGNNAKYASSKSNYSGFEGGTATYNIEGNIMSLVAGDDFTAATAFSTTFVFCSLFKLSNVVSAENLILPVTTLTEACYRAMFSMAYYLEVAPALPATTLATDCYWYMFEKCPITEAPELPATTLVKGAYGNMFIGCSNLNYIKCLATSITASSCTVNWVSGVSATGTFVKDASMTSWTIGVSGIPTNWIVYDGEAISDPVISCNGEQITITCDTDGASIYYRLNQTGSYVLYSSPIPITADTTVEAYSQKDSNQSNTITQECEYIEHVYKFTGLKISNGPLYYGTNGYEIKDSWNYASYNSVYGKNTGSTYFNFIEMGQLFENSGFTTSDGNILNTLDPLDGWRLPTIDEWRSIMGTTRAGSTVNGNTHKHYAFIQLTGVTHANNSTPYGLLVFPDEETITGVTLSNMDDTTCNTGITEAQLNTYIGQGCVFLPASGSYWNSKWEGNGIDCSYWSSSEYNTTQAYHIYFSHAQDHHDSKSSTYYPIRLVKDTTYGEETPFEGATKDLNNWTI